MAKRKPWTVHERSLPDPRGEMSEASTANGPAITDADCNTSTKLSPKSRRRRVVFSPPDEHTIAVAMVEDEMRDIDAVIICTHDAVTRATVMFFELFFVLSCCKISMHTASFFVIYFLHWDALDTLVLFGYRYL